MIIANPIYDVVFKRLMEDDRIAKFFIGTLLDQTIEEVQVQPQEFTYTDQLAGLSVYRVDFIATIRTAAGGYRKVLIEIQKAKNLVDLMRFRNYLAEQYKKEDEVETEIGRRKVPLPIVTIYLLGFALPEIETSAVRVARQYLDLITNRVIKRKSEFIEKLTHDCFVIQLPRIQPKYQTKLEKLLSVFEQAHFVDDKRIVKQYDHAIDEAGVKTMTEVLHYIGTDPAEKKHIEDEQEAYRVLDLAVREKTDELKAELMKSRQELEDKNKTLEEQRKALDDQARLIEELKRQLGKE